MFENKKLVNLLGGIQADIKQLAKELQLIKSDINEISKNSPTLLKKWHITASRQNVWDFKNAQECLDIIIINASLNNTQTLIFQDYEVEVIKKEKSKKQNIVTFNQGLE